MAPHSSTLARKIPWTEEPGRLQSMGSLRVGHHWVTSFSLFTFMHWRRKWQPTPVFLPGESQGQGSLVGCHLWGSHRVGHDWSDLAAAATRTTRICNLTNEPDPTSSPKLGVWLGLAGGGEALHSPEKLKCPGIPAAIDFGGPEWKYHGLPDHPTKRWPVS